MAAMTRSWVSSPSSSPTLAPSRRTAIRLQVRSISSISEEMNMMLFPSPASWIISF